MDNLKFDEAIGKLHEHWDATATRQIIGDLVTAIGRAGGLDDPMRGRAAAIRRLLQERLSAAQSPAEQFALLNLCYALTQGVGNRDEALDLARRAEGLSQQVATPMERVRAVFQMAKAYLYVNRNADAVDWTRVGLQLGDQLERGGNTGGQAASGTQVGTGGQAAIGTHISSGTHAAGGTPVPAAISDVERKELRRLLADQESRQVNRMATLGGLDAEVDRVADSCLARWEQLGDPRGMAGGLGMLVEARVFQGRWAEAVELARKALAAVGYPPKEDSAITYSLCFGALALCRLGDPQTALTWTTDAASLSQQAGNHECVLEARAVHAVALAGIGRVDEALREIDLVVPETVALNMAEMTHWVVGMRGWIRMQAGVPAAPEELLEAYQFLRDQGYHVTAAEVLYAASCALRLAGRGGQAELAEAIAQFERFNMTWHLGLARRGALVG